MTITFAIGTATIAAGAAAFLQMLQPETWAPFYRLALARKTNRKRTVAALFIGLAGQAATTAAVALFMTIVILSVVAAADERVYLWAGIAVMALSLVFFARSVRHNSSLWTNAAQLIDAMASGSPAASDPYGKPDQSMARIVRSAIFSPRFILAPMFLAASASGQPGVGNALPVVIAYFLFSIGGLVWLVKVIGEGDARGVLHFLVRRMNLLVGIGVLVLGIITAIAG